MILGGWENFTPTDLALLGHLPPKGGGKYALPTADPWLPLKGGAVGEAD